MVPCVYIFQRATSKISFIFEAFSLKIKVFIRSQNISSYKWTVLKRTRKYAREIRRKKTIWMPGYATNKINLLKSYVLD